MGEEVFDYTVTHGQVPECYISDRQYPHQARLGGQGLTFFQIYGVPPMSWRPGNIRQPWAVAAFVRVLVDDRILQLDRNVCLHLAENSV